MHMKIATSFFFPICKLEYIYRHFCKSTKLYPHSVKKKGWRRIDNKRVLLIPLLPFHVPSHESIMTHTNLRGQVSELRQSIFKFFQKKFLEYEIPIEIIMLRTVGTYSEGNLLVV